jgi:NAD(P)-dependent dehydrogenase (short-subunit alcohol dehydrogenase family)
MSAYSASKAAVRNLARTWAEELKGTGIRVNVLSPGGTVTDLAKAALGEEGTKFFASLTPLKRMADPAEIGAAAAFLASSDSSFMTASEVSGTRIQSNFSCSIGYGNPASVFPRNPRLSFEEAGRWA